MRSTVMLVSFLVFAGCASLPQSGRRSTGQLLGDIKAQVQELQEKQTKSDIMQQQLVETTGEILRMLSELYQRR